jgi:tetratricopeptide (TPR) repeat protein
MGAHRQLDAAGRSKAGRVNSLLVTGLAGLLVFLAAAGARAQQTLVADDSLAAAQKLYSEKKWEETVRAASGSAVQSSELDYLRGMALVHLERWLEARDAFSLGLLKTPRDFRFLLERAGAEYRLKDFASAKKDLLEALRLNPKDDYAAEFLGTIYLLEGNLEATLKYGNRIQKPRLSHVASEPEPLLQTKLISQAMAFNAPQVLSQSAWLTTKARLDNLGVFPQSRVELQPTGDSDYAAILHVNERGGWEYSRWSGAISLLSGVPYQTVYPEWYNIGRRAINFSSLVRWDPEKRRAFASLSFPVGNQSDRVVEVFVDGRDENWNLSQTFFASSSAITDLNLRRIEAGIELRSVVNGNWSWTAGAGVIGRSFRNGDLTANLAGLPYFTNSTSLEASASAKRVILRVPEHRFTVVGSVESRLGRGYKENLGPFGTIGGSLRTDWLPHAKGEDDAVHARIRSSNLFGTVPLDQLFELGLDRDSTLWLRGHGATTGGRKGGAPLGRRYVLINSEYDRVIYDGGFFRVLAGPFLDMGKISDDSAAFGDPRWLVDTGAQVKLRVLGSVSIVLSYGRDLRDGRGTFFGTTER